ncbi:hypothetical protein TSMEX_005153 [Taenia solium]|eukprot:TsM_000175900 transcript=TsM_000175900 gene=TsM_000175900
MDQRPANRKPREAAKTSCDFKTQGATYCRTFLLCYITMAVLASVALASSHLYCLQICLETKKAQRLLHSSSDKNRVELPAYHQSSTIRGSNFGPYFWSMIYLILY